MERESVAGNMNKRTLKTRMQCTALDSPCSNSSGALHHHHLHSAFLLQHANHSTSIGSPAQTHRGQFTLWPKSQEAIRLSKADWKQNRSKESLRDSREALGLGKQTSNIQARGSGKMFTHLEEPCAVRRSQVNSRGKSEQVVGQGSSQESSQQ